MIFPPSQHLPFLLLLSSSQRALIVAERLRAYREDLAEWFSNLFQINITEDTLLSSIENGVLLCRLVLLIDQNAPANHKVVGMEGGRRSRAFNTLPLAASAA